MDAHRAAVDFRSRRGRPGASPPRASEASGVAGWPGDPKAERRFLQCPLCAQRVSDSPQFWHLAAECPCYCRGPLRDICNS